MVCCMCAPRRGFYDPASKPVVLTKQSVDGIQLQGGTILGTSRGGANIRCGAGLFEQVRTCCCVTARLMLWAAG